MIETLFAQFFGRSGALFAAMTAAAVPATFQRTALGSHRVVLEDLTLVDPDLHTTGAIGRLRCRHAIVDIGAKRMQRHPALAIPFGARNFCTAKTSRTVDADAAGAKAHRRLHRPLHRTAERHTTFELLGDILGNQRRVDLGLAHFNNVEMHFRARDLANVPAKLLDIRTLLADNDTGASRVDRYAALLVRTLDHDLRNTSLLQLIVEKLANLEVFMQQLTIFMATSKPARVPCAVDAEPQTDRIYLVTHQACSSTCRTTMVIWLNGF